MKVLVTGTGSLLLGGIASELLRRGDEVVCLQRRPAAFFGHQNAREVLADICDAKAVALATQGCDAVIHGAARVGVVGSQKDFYDTNVRGTENIIRAAEQHNLSRLVFVSTPSVAHTGDSLIGALAGEAEIGRSRSHYAESKAVAERTVLHARSNQLAVIAIRPHLVWGPGDTQLVGRIVDRAASGRLAVIGT